MIIFKKEYSLKKTKKYNIIINFSCSNRSSFTANQNLLINVVRSII